MKRKQQNHPGRHCFDQPSPSTLCGRRCDVIISRKLLQSTTSSRQDVMVLVVIIIAWRHSFATATLLYLQLSLLPLLRWRAVSY